MNIVYLHSFDKSYQKLSSAVQQDIDLTISRFLEILPQGKRPQGIGLRLLSQPNWEIRVGLKYRILLQLKNDTITFTFVGNHDEVKRFLKRF